MNKDLAFVLSGVLVMPFPFALVVWDMDSFYVLASLMLAVFFWIYAVRPRSE